MYFILDDPYDTFQLIWKYNSDGGPTCWYHLVRSVTLMASDPAANIYDKMDCFKENGNNIEVGANEMFCDVKMVSSLFLGIQNDAGEISCPRAGSRCHGTGRLWQ